MQFKAYLVSDIVGYFQKNIDFISILAFFLIYNDKKYNEPQVIKEKVKKIGFSPIFKGLNCHVLVKTSCLRFLLNSIKYRNITYSHSSLKVSKTETKKITKFLGDLSFLEDIAVPHFSSNFVIHNFSSISLWIFNLTVL
ncbi:hypothetical protein ACKWTF_001654 [Chironomus riparius]